MLEADPEEDVTVSVSAAHALRRVEGVDLQLEHPGGQNLQQNRVRLAGPVLIQNKKATRLTAFTKARSSRYLRWAILLHIRVRVQTEVLIQHAHNSPLVQTPRDRERVKTWSNPES